MVLKRVWTDKGKLDKPDAIEVDVNSINTKIARFEKRLPNTESLVCDLLNLSARSTNHILRNNTAVESKMSQVEESLAVVETEIAILREKTLTTCRDLPLTLKKRRPRGHEK